MSRAGVVTLTAAGAIDATYRIGMLQRGAFARADAYQRELSGKGVNVAAALALAGRPTVAVVVLGEDDVAFAARSPHAALLRVVEVPGATRVNTSVIDADAATTKINAPTPPISPAAWHAVRTAVAEEGERIGAGWLVISGSLPHLLGGSAPVDITAIVHDAVRAGRRVALDTSGTGLMQATRNPEGIDLLKPNTQELAELCGHPLRTVGDVARAARALIDRGITAVYTSMGADGVLVVTRTDIVHARATASAVVNTAGAGDASLAGFLVGLGALDPAAPGACVQAAAAAASWGAHAVAQLSTVLPHIEALPEAGVERDPDPMRLLSEPAVG